MSTGRSTSCPASIGVLISPLQVLDFLGEMIRSEPAALGDMHKESPEELAERHERVLSSALAALAALLDSLLPLKPSAHPGTSNCLHGSPFCCSRLKSMLSSLMFPACMCNVALEICITSSKAAYKCWCCADEIGGGAVTRVTEILLEQGTLKRLLNAKSPIAVRRACYSLIALMSKRCMLPFSQMCIISVYLE